MSSRLLEQGSTLGWIFLTALEADVDCGLPSAVLVRSVWRRLLELEQRILELEQEPSASASEAR